MDYRLDCEVRLADHHRTTADVNADGWRRPAPVARYRVTIAQVLVVLATRIAPTDAMPTTSMQAPAQ